MPISAIIGGVSSIFGSGMSYKGQREANKTNIELARQGREHDVNMWNRQNEYNTPEMQMQRLKEAGLNPNLIYGSGQASTGNADAPKPAHVATTSNALASFNNNNAIQMLGAYQDWQVKKAQIKNIEEETQGKHIQNQLGLANLPYTEDLALYSRESQKYKYYQEANRHQILNDDMNISRNTLSDRVQQSKLKTQYDRGRLGHQKQALDYLKKSTTQKDLQNQLDQQLKPYGMSTADELWQRKLVPLIEDLISPQKWLKNKMKNKSRTPSNYRPGFTGYHQK